MWIKVRLDEVKQFSDEVCRAYDLEAMSVEDFEAWRPVGTGWPLVMDGERFVFFPMTDEAFEKVFQV